MINCTTSPLHSSSGEGILPTLLLRGRHILTNTDSNDNDDDTRGVGDNAKADKNNFGKFKKLCMFAAN